MHLLIFDAFTFQISQAQNRVYLGADTLMLNLNDKDFDASANRVTKQ